MRGGCVCVCEYACVSMCVCVAQMSKNLWQLMPNVAREQGIGILGQGTHTAPSVKLSCKQNWFAAATAHSGTRD